MSSQDRIAVIDVETTGLYRTDRVIEIAVITLTPAGETLDEFETLINPLRDVGPTWLHQITPAMVRDAPTFPEVAQHLASRLDGAICAAHNLPFDVRMLTYEFDRIGLPLTWGAGLDTLKATGCKLSLACERFAIAHEGEHSALGDARATAQLLLATASAHSGFVEPVQAPPVRPTAPRVVTRSGHTCTATPAPYLAQLAQGIQTGGEIAPYVDLLDAVVADLMITPEERAELGDLAQTLDLTDLQITDAHTTFVHGLIDAAVADDVVTDDEYDQLIRCAALLHVDQDLIERRISAHRQTETTISLERGLAVVFTGSAEDVDGTALTREDVESIAFEYGLTPEGDVRKKSTRLLVAADPTTLSGKAKKARQYSIPITDTRAFLAAVRSGSPVAATISAQRSIALVCTTCGSSWLAARKATNPICADCT